MRCFHCESNGDYKHWGAHTFFLFLFLFCFLPETFNRPGVGIMEADDRQVTTVFTVQPSFHHRHSTNPSIMKRYHRQRTYSHTPPRRSPTMVTLHDTRVCRTPMVERRLDCENCGHLTVVGFHDTGPKLRVCKKTFHSIHGQL